MAGEYHLQKEFHAIDRHDDGSERAEVVTPIQLEKDGLIHIRVAVGCEAHYMEYDAALTLRNMLSGALDFLDESFDDKRLGKNQPKEGT